METQNITGERGREMAIPRGRRKLGSMIALAEFPLCLSVGFAELVHLSCDFYQLLVCDSVGCVSMWERWSTPTSAMAPLSPP